MRIPIKNWFSKTLNTCFFPVYPIYINKLITYGLSEFSCVNY